MNLEDFKPGDRVVYRDRHTGRGAQDGSVTSVGSRYVFVCYGLPGSTSQGTDPRDLQHATQRLGDLLPGVLAGKP